jgi:hypothetical protein
VSHASILPEQIITQRIHSYHTFPTTDSADI